MNAYGEEIMFFSEEFGVDRTLLDEYGAIDISLICDIPLFIDPMLIFNSDKEEYKALHEEFIRYFHFLYKKSKENLNLGEVNAWFNFSEIPNNWLGYSLVGNKGRALGKQYAEFLYKKIAFAINAKGISASTHIEKVMLLYEGSGKDKISDLTVNLIKGFLCEYTQTFALAYIKEDLLCEFAIDKVSFSYETESFITKRYKLPFIINEKGKKEFILLTPIDLVREDEPAINRKDFYNSYERICASIDNDDLRSYVGNYIAKAVFEYEEKQKKSKKPIKEGTIKKLEQQAFQDLVNEYPELYDYYIKLRESDGEIIRKACAEETKEIIQKFQNSAKELILLFRQQDLSTDNFLSAQEEAKQRLIYFKHIIEDCDGYKNLYFKGRPIASENDLQRLFRLVWCGTSYKVDAEPNNGRGQADFIISKGTVNQNIVEFKLASNSTLAHVFTQVKIYEKANCSEGSLIAIFYFSETEYFRAYELIVSAGHEKDIGGSIFLIDCRNDNKKSASVA